MTWCLSGVTGNSTVKPGVWRWKHCHPAAGKWQVWRMWYIYTTVTLIVEIWLGGRKLYYIICSHISFIIGSDHSGRTFITFAVCIHTNTSWSTFSLISLSRYLDRCLSGLKVIDLCCDIPTGALQQSEAVPCFCYFFLMRQASLIGFHSKRGAEVPLAHFCKIFCPVWFWLCKTQYSIPTLDPDVIIVLLCVCVF